MLQKEVEFIDFGPLKADDTSPVFLIQCQKSDKCYYFNILFNNFYGAKELKNKDTDSIKALTLKDFINEKIIKINNKTSLSEVFISSLGNQSKKSESFGLEGTDLAFGLYEYKLGENEITSGTHAFLSDFGSNNLKSLLRVVEYVLNPDNGIHKEIQDVYIGVRPEGQLTATESMLLLFVYTTKMT